MWVQNSIAKFAVSRGKKVPGGSSLGYASLRYGMGKLLCFIGLFLSLEVVLHKETLRELHGVTCNFAEIVLYHRSFGWNFVEYFTTVIFLNTSIDCFC